jgi:hypothetical protein
LPKVAKVNRLVLSLVVFSGIWQKTVPNLNLKIPKFLSKTVIKTDCDRTSLLALSTLGDATQNMIVSLLCSIAQGSQVNWLVLSPVIFSGILQRNVLNENFKIAKFLSKTVGKTDRDSTSLLALSTLGDATQNMIVSLLYSIAQGSQDK